MVNLKQLFESKRKYYEAERVYGKHIYDFIKDYAKEIGCYHLTLNVWACNPSAMKFYEAMGLKPQKIHMETILE